MSYAPDKMIRRPKAYVSWYNINNFHLRNPWVVAWWSLAFPGIGHIKVNAIPKGIFLFMGELIINQYAHLNIAIIYSFSGAFESAKQVLDPRWLLLYSGLLFFSVWDSYRLALEHNKLSVLADRQDASLATIGLNGLGSNPLDKRTPWLAAAWSVMMPGLGQLYNHKIPKAFLLITVGGAILVLSNAFQAFVYTLLGQFHQADYVIDAQWLINLPSLYGFAIYDAYTDSVELNKLFENEQRQFFRREFQSSHFPMRSILKGGA